MPGPTVVWSRGYVNTSLNIRRGSGGALLHPFLAKGDGYTGDPERQGRQAGTGDSLCQSGAPWLESMQPQLVPVGAWSGTVMRRRKA